jgi:hypothetical protein
MIALRRGQQRFNGRAPAYHFRVGKTRIFSPGYAREMGW